MKNVIEYFITIFIISSGLLQSQTYNHLSLNDFEISNPAYIGIKDYSHISLSSKQSFDLQNKSSNNTSLYGSYFFENLNFFIGYSLNSFSFSDLGTSQYNASLSYVYKLNLNDESLIYPFISGNIYIPNKFSNLIFESPEPLYMLNSFQDKSYIDLNAGLMFKSTYYLMSFSLNNLLKAKLTEEDATNSLRLNRTLDLNLGYQNNIIRNTLGFAFLASYFYRPSSYNEFNFSEIRLDQVFLLASGLEIGGFQEFYSNSFSKKIKSIGFNAKINLNQFEIGVNYKNSKSKEISNTENYLGINLRFKFNLTKIENYLNKW